MQAKGLSDVNTGEAVVVRRLFPPIPASRLVARLHNGSDGRTCGGPKMIALADFLAGGRNIACQRSPIIARLGLREERDQRGRGIVSSLVQKSAGVEMRVGVNLMRGPGGAGWGCWVRVFDPLGLDRRLSLLQRDRGVVISEGCRAREWLRGV